MKRPRVTDHAVLRYLERAKFLDIEAVRAHIADLCAGPMAAGASRLHAEGVTFHFDGAAVVTVAPRSSLPNRTSRAKLAAGAR